MSLNVESLCFVYVQVQSYINMWHGRVGVDFRPHPPLQTFRYYGYGKQTIGMAYNMSISHPSFKSSIL